VSWRGEKAGGPLPKLIWDPQRADDTYELRSRNANCSSSGWWDPIGHVFEITSKNFSIILNNPLSHLNSVSPYTKSPLRGLSVGANAPKDELSLYESTRSPEGRVKQGPQKISSKTVDPFPRDNSPVNSNHRLSQQVDIRKNRFEYLCEWFEWGKKSGFNR
jgi:hypothetical protein